MSPFSRSTLGWPGVVIRGWTRTGSPATGRRSWMRRWRECWPAPAGKSCTMPAKRAEMLRAALYARVSLDDERQDPASQLTALRAWAEHKRWNVVREAVDRAGARDHARRVYWRSLLADARVGGFDLIAVWSLDRAFRSTLDALKTLEMLNHEGVGFVCLKQDFDTSSPSGRLLFTVLAAVAEIERDMIRERTLAGMARARAQGKRIGRPPGKRDRVRRLRSVQRREPA